MKIRKGSRKAKWSKTREGYKVRFEIKIKLKNIKRIKKNKK